MVFHRSCSLAVAGTSSRVKDLRGPSGSCWWRWQEGSSTEHPPIAHRRYRTTADPRIAVGRALLHVIHGMNSSHVFEYISIARSTFRVGVWGHELQQSGLAVVGGLASSSKVL